MVDARSQNNRRDALDVEAELADSYRELGHAIDNLQCGVEDAIRSQTQRVKDNVTHVKHFFDLSWQISKYPFAALGIATASGVLIGLGSGMGREKSKQLLSRIVEELPHKHQDLFQKKVLPKYSQGIIGIVAPLIAQAGVSYLQKYFAERKNKTSPDPKFDTYGSDAG